MSPAEGKRAPQRIQEIVKAVLQRNAMRGVQLAQPSHYNRAEEMADGRPPAATVRRFMLDYWTDVEIATPDADCRYFSEHLYEMKPLIGIRQRIYVKFGLEIDPDNNAASHIRILRFHPAIDSDPIERIPEARR
jgi:hypothetical protein